MFTTCPRTIFGLTLLGCVLLGATTAESADWPQWRGTNRDNCSTETGLLREWPENGPPLSWTAVGLGEGIASLAVAEGKIVTLGYQDQSEFVVALEESTGELAWATRIGPAVAENPLMRWLSQRTPTVDEDRLYAITAGGELVCLSTAGGKEIWRKSYMADFAAPRSPWGFCEYPLVDDDKLICTPGGPKAHVVALDKKTGTVIWQSAMPGPELHREDHMAIVRADVSGLRQYVTFLNQRLTGVAADDGRFLWRYEKTGNNTANSQTPIVRGDRVFCSSGFGNRAALLKLVRDGNTVKVEEHFQRQLNLDPFQDATVLDGEQVFMLRGPGILTCIDFNDGHTIWEERISRAGRQATVFADGCLYLRGSEGQMVMAQVAAEGYVAKGRFAVPDHEASLGATSPVIAGGRLYLRDNARLHCYDLRADTPQGPPANPRTIQLTVVEAAGREEAGAPAKGPRDGRPPNGVFVPTPHDVVTAMLDLAQIEKADVVYDLGSGDGRIVIAAAKKYGCKAVGYDIDPELVVIARRKSEAEGVDKLVTIERADVFTVDLTNADVVTLYLLPQQNEKLVGQLKKMKPGSRVVSHQFEIPGIKPESTATIESQEGGEKHLLFLYKVPLQSR